MPDLTGRRNKPNSETGDPGGDNSAQSGPLPSYFPKNGDRTRLVVPQLSGRTEIERASLPLSEHGRTGIERASLWS